MSIPMAGLRSAKLFSRLSLASPAIHVAGAILVVVILFASTMMHGQHFTYPLDDTYIHMTLARTLAETGVWGIDTQTPVAASSSPLWTIMLACIYVAARRMSDLIWVPLVLNLAFVTAVICLNAHILKAYPRAALLIMITWLFTALPSVAAIGMEHVVHVFFITLFLYQSVIRLTSERDTLNVKGRGDWQLALTAALAATSRYESLFVIVPVVLYGLYKGQLRLACWMALGTALPLLGLGVLWVHGGGWMLPNALLLKGASAKSSNPGFVPWLIGVGRNAGGNLLAKPALVSHAITLVHLFLAIGNRRAAPRVILFSRLTLIGVVAQILFASFGWLYRYDAWLIQLNLLSIFMLTHQFPRQTIARSALLVPLLCVLLLSNRFYGGLIKTPRAMEDRRWEHVMPSDFSRQYMRGQTVLVNDLGVLAYQGGIKVVDIFGLGNNLVLSMRRSAQGYGASQVSEIAKGSHADSAIVQLCWEEVSGRMPSEWKLIGVWEGARNVVFGDKIVAVFSLKRIEDNVLTRAFSGFTPTAPVKIRDQAFVDRFNLADAATRGSMIAQLCKR